ncbi:MAG: 30S ribosomal protein S15 [Halobacteriota archaeon]|nr:30S ribosomal protein S15 [Halobacteriota archaeon]
MARMYSRRKGKSRSTRPLRASSPEWLDQSPEEIEKAVVELRGQGHSTAKIGTILRDRYGVPDVSLATGKKITGILKENDKAPNVPEDLENLIVKALRMRRHLDINPKDLHNKRSLQLTESKVRRLVKYYKRQGLLPADWSYKPQTAEVLITQD